MSSIPDEPPPPKSMATLAETPHAVRRSMPMALSILLGILGSILVLWLIYHLGRLLLLVYLSFVLATILDVPVSWLQRHRVPRLLATLALMVLLGAIVGLGAYFLVLTGLGQFQDLSQHLQALPHRFQERLEQLRHSHAYVAQIINRLDLQTFFSHVSGQWPDMAKGVLLQAWQGLEILTYGLVTFFLVFYMLAEGPGQLRTSRALLPPRHRSEVTVLLEQMIKAHRGWFAANLSNVLAAGALTSFGLWMLGIPAWFLLGMLAGLGELVPNIGPGLAATPTLILTLVVLPETFPAVLIMFLLVQTLQSYGISPLTMRHGVSLPPLATILAALAMGTLLGFLGILVAIPMTADLSVLWSYLLGLLAPDPESPKVREHPDRGARS